MLLCIINYSSPTFFFNRKFQETMKNVALKRGFSKKKKASGKSKSEHQKDNDRKDLAALLHGVPKELIPSDLKFLVKTRGFIRAKIIPDLENKVHEFMAQHLRYYADQLEGINRTAIPKDLLFLLSPLPQTLLSIPFKSWQTLQRAIDLSTKGYFIIKYDRKRPSNHSLKIGVTKKLRSVMTTRGSRTRQQIDRKNLKIVHDGQIKPVQCEVFNFINDCEKRCKESTDENVHFILPLLLSTFPGCTDQQAHTDFKPTQLVTSINNNEFNAFDFPCSVIMALEDHTCLKVWV